MNLNELVGKRVLVSEKPYGFSQQSRTVKELKVLELAPTGNWVKVMNDDGRKYWLHYSDINVIEVLSGLEPNPNKTSK
ncbi:MAG: hypothetical protein PHF25_06950 [Candidatus Margulisbacteria bacterium]|nr:hypothetical protein [Candidatus Margulisiibacteriota bacterium]